ncbi:DUF1616 domain-containing protein [Staphylothermus hellenicus]|uniref:DUF1616 domain-containing protein n=1 Tax=Staphylothermus hellenicus (strain DSM 12710 / JCM 10830 / BK20S6-10-b1 / P8) TaxID=591019 RepID=D7D879_STAHD|nr:DUF1616 domain-containing protein [Staphylothermus hellenicus]ADI31975.1 Protein of unknown function DUF1616 [Staphylothermus hellenicus DSM 12710]
MEKETLEELVNKKLTGKKSLYSAIREVYKDESAGKIKLIDPSPPTSFAEYMRRLDYSLWFWSALTLIVLAPASITLSNIAPSTLPLRYVFGSIYILFIPGYVLVEALYPEEKSLTPLERLALSIGLSLAIIPLIGLLLNYTPWGIRLEPIVTSTIIYAVAMLFIAAYRKYTIVKMVAETIKSTK